MSKQQQKNTKSASKKKRKTTIRRPQHSQKKVIEAIQGTGGIITQIAERLRCTRQTVYNYLKRYPKVKEAYDQEKDMILDVCEEGIFAKIYAQDLDAIKYYLAKKGHDRGYGEVSDFGKGVTDKAQFTMVFTYEEDREDDE